MSVSPSTEHLGPGVEVPPGAPSPEYCQLNLHTSNNYSLWTHVIIAQAHGMDCVAIIMFSLSIHHPSSNSWDDDCNVSSSLVKCITVTGGRHGVVIFSRLAHHLYHRNFNYPCHGAYVIIINITIIHHNHNPFTPRAIFQACAPKILPRPLQRLPVRS